MGFKLQLICNYVAVFQIHPFCGLRSLKLQEEPPLLKFFRGRGKGFEMGNGFCHIVLILTVLIKVHNQSPTHTLVGNWYNIFQMFSQT